MEKTFRESDVLARLGGDEFVVLALAAQDSGQWIRSRLDRNLRKADGNGNGYALSLSVGIARFDPKHAVTLGEPMVQADKAMYKKNE